ncbi:MAG: GNAT family N-acetyltransferase [Candidatus Obscuribacterales bacterium]|nr:GNAT family N-acetyltransferase [Candidatus Obscuribacterales bacterium]
MSNEFTPKAIRRFRFSELKSEPTRLSIFEDWVTNMTMEKDGEYGEDRIVDGKVIPGFWSWILEQNEDPEFLASDLYGTFVWMHYFTGVVIATGTIAPDDRFVKRDNNLGGDGLWGGVNVRSGHGLRGQGIGRRIVKELDEHVASFAQTQSRIFHLFTANPIAERMYVNLGYERNGMINTDAFGDERLLTKIYHQS